MSCFRAIHALALALIVGCVACAEEPPPNALAADIDRLIEARLAEEEVPAAEVIDEGEYLRRVTLDLAGRIPTDAERLQFAEFCSRRGGTREQVVDLLMALPDFSFHQRNELDILLLASLQWNSEFRIYLLEAMREHRSWDQLTREILLPEKARPGDKGAAAFLKQRAKDLDALTNDTSTLLFGVNIACAKCHDHPLVPDWKQDHYFGFASFFKRTFTTRSGLLAERFDGELKFTTVDGEEKRARFMFLSGKTVEEPPLSISDDEWKHIREQLKKAEQDDKADAPPTPPFSPREQLVSLALEVPTLERPTLEKHALETAAAESASEESSAGDSTSPESTMERLGRQPLLARNLANRLWARLMGRGLVHPLDQMHSGNPPSHPELLARLTDELLASHYDPRPVIRGIVLSRAYARSTRWTHDEERPAPEHFAVQTPRPLTPFQYSLSLWVASRNPVQLPGMDKPEDWAKQREQWEQRSEGFARRFEIPGEQFQVPVEEALLLSNNPQFENEFLANQSGTLVGHLKTLGSTPDSIEVAYHVALGRDPSKEEREAAEKYLEARKERSDMGLQQVVWALLTSAEFRFNH